jgi:tetratricopeptide (TPR) repeat protein
VTLPCNLRDFPPYRSEHGSALSEEDLEEWKKVYWKGIQSIDRKEWDRALGYLVLAEKMDPLYAEGPFMTGKVFCQKKDWEMAKDKFWRAVRLDAWPMRAFFEMNRIIRNQSRNGGMFLADAERYFSDKSEGGIPGDDWFLDHCHPDLDGNITIARSIISGISSAGLIRLPQDWAQTYNDICEDYRDDLPDYWLAEAYYRAAFETGMNVKRLERGLRLAGRAKQHDPSNPKISTLIHNLSILRESGP